MARVPEGTANERGHPPHVALAIASRPQAPLGGAQDLTVVPVGNLRRLIVDRSIMEALDPRTRASLNHYLQSHDVTLQNRISFRDCDAAEAASRGASSSGPERTLTLPSAGTVSEAAASVLPSVQLARVAASPQPGMDETSHAIVALAPEAVVLTDIPNLLQLPDESREAWEDRITSAIIEASNAKRTERELEVKRAEREKEIEQQEFQELLANARRKAEKDKAERDQVMERQMHQDREEQQEWQELLANARAKAEKDKAERDQVMERQRQHDRDNGITNHHDGFLRKDQLGAAGSKAFKNLQESAAKRHRTTQ